MANPDIALLGAVYSGVSGVTLPKSGGGTATFPWVEGSQTITQNGTYNVAALSEAVVNVSGGGAGGGTSIDDEPTLSAAYQKVAYLDFDGASYFEIPYQMQMGDMVDVLFERLEIGAEQPIIAPLANISNYFELYIAANNGYFGAYRRNGATTLLNFNDSRLATSSFTLDIQSDTKYYASTYLTSGSTDYNLCIGRRHTAWYKSRIYKIRVSSVAHGAVEPRYFLIPCYRKADNEPGLFDTVNNVFYINQGTGTLTPGPDV